MIGRILASAEALGKKAFIYVYTDGGCGGPDSDSADGPWTFDRGTAGVTFMLAYDPAGRPATRSFQLGHFTSGQVADDTSVIGSSGARAGLGAFANWLRLNGKLELFQTLAPNQFSDAVLNNDILRFG